MNDLIINIILFVIIPLISLIIIAIIKKEILKIAIILYILTIILTLVIYLIQLNIFIDLITFNWSSLEAKIPEEFKQKVVSMLTPIFIFWAVYHFIFGDEGVEK